MIIISAATRVNGTAAAETVFDFFRLLLYDKAACFSKPEAHITEKR